MRYRIVKAFTDRKGMHWQPGDTYPGADDDPEEYVKQGFLEDADKPATEKKGELEEGTNLARANIEGRADDYTDQRTKAEAEGRDLYKEQREQALKDSKETTRTGSETHAKTRDEKSGESDQHQGTRAKR